MKELVHFVRTIYEDDDSSKVAIAYAKMTHKVMEDG